MAPSERLQEAREAASVLARADPGLRKAAAARFLELSPHAAHGEIGWLAEAQDPLGRIEDVHEPMAGLGRVDVRVPVGILAVPDRSASPRIIASAFVSGNALILEADEAIRSSAQQALREAGLPPEAIQAPGEHGGSRSWREHADAIVGASPDRTPLAGSEPAPQPAPHVCHTYVDGATDLATALDVCLEAKTGEPREATSDTFLVHEAIAEAFLPTLRASLEAEGVELEAGEAARRRMPGVPPACASTWDTDHGPSKCGVRVVGSLEEAIEHVNAHGSRRADAILTSDTEAARAFLLGADTANAVLDTATTRTAANALTETWPMRRDARSLAPEELTRSRAIHLPAKMVQGIDARDASLTSLLDPGDRSSP